jgi:site-specific DNA recombinase
VSWPWGGADRYDCGRRAGGLGGGIGPSAGKWPGARRPAVRVLRAGVDGGLAGPESSRARQREQADALVRGHGRVVAEFFDEGQSRAVAWGRRPQAAALLAQLPDPVRGWDAIVVGEYERAFYGSQYALVAPLLGHYGVQLWMPEAGGRVDFASEHDEQTMTMLGLSSKREVARTSIRVRTAMAVQAREQGRYLGGRPPYGYCLGDAGPHPNKAHAAWGRRAHRLEPDPQTANIVRWIFAQRLAGHPVARIARALNEAGVPCPSAADRGRNPHRTGAGWTLGTVTAILGNPRYTGHQVWNRQRTDKELADPADVSLGLKDVQRWNVPDGWIISRISVHQALVSETDYIAAQEVGAARGPAPRTEMGAPGRRTYLLAGLLRCRECGRRMESAWSNGRAAYRCRHGSTSASAPDPGRPRNAFIREDRILPHLPALNLILAGPDGSENQRRRRTRRGADARHQASPEDVIARTRAGERGGRGWPGPPRRGSRQRERPRQVARPAALGRRPPGRSDGAARPGS